MNTAEVLQLCRLVKACCPSQALDTYTPDAWALILGGYDYADAQAAVIAIAGSPLELARSRYIEPGHIIDGIRRIRAKRLESTPLPEPPAALAPAEYSAWLGRTREAIASGTYVPEPEPPAIAAPGRRDLAIESATPRLVGVEPDPEPVKPRMSEAEINAERARQLAALQAITQEES